MDRRTLLVAGGAVALGAGALAFMPGGKSTSSDLLVGMADAQTTDAPPSTIPDMVMGSADAKVEVIEYASFTCPHCAAFHADQYQKIKANYIDTGKIRFVYREVYFDRIGLWASMIARCGGELRFFGIADMIYDKQRDWAASGDPAVIVEELRKLAKTAGLDDAMLDTCMQDTQQAQSLVAWFEENAKRDEINSTPTFLIDGVKYSNMSYDDFAALLDEKLAG
jgi:protein-disulfide isomerase